MEYFIRIACIVKELVSIERSQDFSPEFTTSTLDQTHLTITYHIHSFVFFRPVKEKEKNKFDFIHSCSKTCIS